MGPETRRTPFSAAIDIRYVGSVAGRYTLPEAEEQGVYSCRTASLSPTTIVLQAPFPGSIGERVAMRLDHLGLLNGSITHVQKGGFHVALIADETERLRLAAKINWLKKRNLRQADDKRSGARFLPRNPRGHLTVGGSEHECFIIDLSVSGAALSARHMPPLAAAVVIGNISAIVIRHFEGGFGVRFDQPQTLDTVEAEAISPHLPADAG